MIKPRSVVLAPCLVLGLCLAAAAAPSNGRAPNRGVASKPPVARPSDRPGRPVDPQVSTSAPPINPGERSLGPNPVVIGRDPASNSM